MFELGTVQNLESRTEKNMSKLRKTFWKMEDHPFPSKAGVAHARNRQNLKMRRKGFPRVCGWHKNASDQNENDSIREDWKGSSKRGHFRDPAYPSLPVFTALRHKLMKQADARKPTLTFPSKAYAENELAHVQFALQYKSRGTACTKEIRKSLKRKE